jgi:ubiquinone biosynthesis protein UbiJ
VSYTLKAIAESWARALRGKAGMGDAYALAQAFASEIDSLKARVEGLETRLHNRPPE